MSDFFNYDNKYDTNLKFIEINLSEKFETIELFALSDLHIGKKDCDVELFDKWVQFIKDQPNRFVVLNGDLLEAALKTSKSFDYTGLGPEEEVELLIEKIGPIKDRIVGATIGNHCLRYSEHNYDVMKRVMKELDQLDRYGGIEILIKLTFGKRKNYGKKRQCYTIYATHGSAGGKRKGSAINGVNDLAYGVLADIYIVGHTHKLIATKDIIRVPDLRNNNIMNCTRYYMVSSHWMHSLPSYAARIGCQPSAKGCCMAILHASEKHIVGVI
jgi:hypothetical protein